MIKTLNQKGCGFDMTGEIKSFRRQLIGGFDRRDVMSYIAKISHERNMFSQTKFEAERALSKLADEIERLNGELEEANAAALKGREDRQAAFDAAALVFEDLKAAFGQVHKDITEAFARVNAELAVAAIPVEKLPDVIEKTEEKLRGMQVASGGEQTDEPPSEPCDTEQDGDAGDGKLLSIVTSDKNEEPETVEGWQ